MSSLISAFQELAKINKIELKLKAGMDPKLSENLLQDPIIISMAKKWSLKEAINFSSTNKKYKKLMEPIIEKKIKKIKENQTKWVNDLHINLTEEELNNIIFLDLSYNMLTYFPNNLELPNLTRLDLSVNELTGFSDNISFPNLEFLN